MGWSICFFCYDCKEFCTCHNPDMEALDNLLEEQEKNTPFTEAMKHGMEDTEKMDSFSVFPWKALRKHCYKKGFGSDVDQFIIKHRDHNIPNSTLCCCTSYGSYVWEPPLSGGDEEESCDEFPFWADWKGAVYHPRTLMEDYGCTNPSRDWPLAKQLISAFCWLKDGARLTRIFAKYHDLYFNNQLKSRYVSFVPNGELVQEESKQELAKRLKIEDSNEDEENEDEGDEDEEDNEEEEDEENWEDEMIEVLSTAQRMKQQKVYHVPRLVDICAEVIIMNWQGPDRGEERPYRDYLVENAPEEVLGIILENLPLHIQLPRWGLRNLVSLLPSDEDEENEEEEEEEKDDEDKEEEEEEEEKDDKEEKKGKGKKKAKAEDYPPYLTDLVISEVISGDEEQVLLSLFVPYEDEDIVRQMEKDMGIERSKPTTKEEEEGKEKKPKSYWPKVSVLDFKRWDRGNIIGDWHFDIFCRIPSVHPDGIEPPPAAFVQEIHVCGQDLISFRSIRKIFAHCPLLHTLTLQSCHSPQLDARAFTVDEQQQQPQQHPLPNLRKVDLTGCKSHHIGDEGIVALLQRAIGLESLILDGFTDQAGSEGIQGKQPFTAEMFYYLPETLKELSMKAVSLQKTQEDTEEAEKEKEDKLTRHLTTKVTKIQSLALPRFSTRASGAAAYKWVSTLLKDAKELSTLHFGSAVSNEGEADLPDAIGSVDALLKEILSDFPEQGEEGKEKESERGKLENKKRIAQLRELGLQGTDVTDDTLEKIGVQWGDSLRHLSLASTRLVTPSGIIRLAEASQSARDWNVKKEGLTFLDLSGYSTFDGDALMKILDANGGTLETVLVHAMQKRIPSKKLKKFFEETLLPWVQQKEGPKTNIYLSG